MTDWSRYKIAELKEECKSRAIPLTGLKLKQHYIDKLEDHESQTDAQIEQNGNEQDVEMVGEEHTLQTNGNILEPNGADSDKDEDHEPTTPKKEVAEKVPLKHDDTLEPDVPSVLQVEESRARAQSENEAQSPSEAPALADDAGGRGALFLPEPEAIDEKLAESRHETSAEGDQEQAREVQHSNGGLATPSQPERSPKEATSPTAQSTQIPSDTSTPRTSQIPPSDIAEDQRNRRKRSATPVPSTEEMSRKRVRLSEEKHETQAEEALEQMEADTEQAKEIRMEPTRTELEEHPTDEHKEVAVAVETRPTTEDTNEMSLAPLQEMPPSLPTRSRSPSEDRHIPPAMHPATNSLYISRLKRPLQPQQFRKHIIAKAKSRSSDDSDPITSFYLDSIKTHAFVSFDSVSAASRVRSAMHGVRYPEEASREALFVDYVPDDKVQSWIDQETDSGFGRVRGGRCVFEVVYEKGRNGVEAIFQEADPTRRRPPVEPSLNSRISFDRQQPPTAPSGVHSDRAAFVPRDHRNRDREYSRAPPTGPKSSNSDTGKGFKALDELFSSTTVKPKLYYKTVSSTVADERSDMFRDLRAGYAEMGRTGDEGMKRYSFDRVQDREEWVDKGPEFGHGRRGQERLVGADRGGRGRGRGGGYRSRPMDSWRGGSGR